MVLYHYLLEVKDPIPDFLCMEERRCCDIHVPRCALMPYHASSFEYISISDNNQTLINATGHDHASFDTVLWFFRSMHRHYTFDYNTGLIRKKVCDIFKPLELERDLSPIGCFGLVLMWYHTSGSCARSLTIMFGQTSSLMYRWLKFGQWVLLHVLSWSSIAQVKPPTEQEICRFQN